MACPIRNIINASMLSVMISAILERHEGHNNRAGLHRSEETR